jgi:CheY-like chemotaxis protein
VLVVEDEILIRMDIAYELGEAGFTVYEAGDAAQALGQLEAHPDIGALFTDIDMPGEMDGLWLASATRSHWPHVKTVLTSGHIRVGIDDVPGSGWFVPKPCEPAKVIVLLRRLLGSGVNHARS